MVASSFIIFSVDFECKVRNAIDAYPIHKRGVLHPYMQVSKYSMHTHSGYKCIRLELCTFQFNQHCEGASKISKNSGSRQQFKFSAGFVRFLPWHAFRGHLRRRYAAYASSSISHLPNHPKTTHSSCAHAPSLVHVGRQRMGLPDRSRERKRERVSVCVGQREREPALT